MKIIIFGGPTVSEQEVKNILVDAIYLPPVKHADILGAMDYYNPDVIGIIDGIIASELSVWHKEILFAIENGIRIFGAGGMGALRAAELYKLGMYGSGQLFELYKNGDMEDDDEIFAKFEIKDGYYFRLSEPMVNLRETFKRALQDKIIDPSFYRVLVDIAKSLFFTERSFENVFKKAYDNDVYFKQLEDLKRFIVDFQADLLKQDALEMLREIANLSPEDISTRNKEDKGFKPYSMIFAPFYERTRPVRYADIEFPRYYISNYLCLYHPDAEALNFDGLNREIALYLADIMKIEVNTADIEMEVNRFKSKHHLEDDKAFEKWLNENDLPERDFKCLFEKQARLRKMHQWFFTSRRMMIKNTSYFLDQLKLENKYVDWKEKVGHREKLVREKDPVFKKEFSKDNFPQLLQYFLENNRLPWNVPIKDAADEMGMRKNDIKIEWLKEFFYRKYISELVINTFEN